MPNKGIMITGKINIAGYYTDCLPILIINLKKEDVQSISFKYNIRVPVNLEICGSKYIAGVRYIRSKRDIKICSDLLDEAGEQVRLAEILLQNGYTRGDTIQMEARDDGVEIYSKYHEE